MSTPLESELAAETKNWMLKAAEDLRAARVLLASDPPLLETALFHCQQAAEKALKAFLTWHGVTFRKTHNLEEIGEQCLAVDDSPGRRGSSNAAHCVRLDVPLPRWT